MTTSGEQSATHWWDSFYWRVGVIFVVFVVGVVMAQSVIFTYRIERDSAEIPARAPNNISIAVADRLGAALEAGSVGDLAAFLRQHFGQERSVYVLLKDGRLAGVSPEPLHPAMRAAAEMSLHGEAATDPGEQPRVPGPVVFAPVQAGGQLLGLVIMPPPRPQGIIWDAARFLSLPGVLILVTATIVAAFVIFGPARRRLMALEGAAVRLGGGDLTARAPEDGRDEISSLAKSFNRMGDALAARDEALRTSDRLRRQLLADVSHELKTPLTSMRGYLETVQMNDGQLAAEQRRRYLDTVADETLRLERIVGDLVDLARFENDAVALDVRVFAVTRLFEHVTRRHERESSARRVRLHADVAPTADQAYADPYRLEQAVENLVANAMRYVPDGGTIQLSATTEAAQIRLTVVDSGPGIAPEHLAHVFDRFYKGDPARAAGGVGSGLGLSIVKAIVERHGGSIGVTSHPGRTAFMITLPNAVVFDGDERQGAGGSSVA
jgi:two-component system OmpR family sensor kinase